MPLPAPRTPGPGARPSSPHRARVAHASALAGRFAAAPSITVLLALIAGLAIGATLAATHTPVLAAATAIAAPVGTLWINAIQATVIPLVVSLLITGIASAAGTRAVGRLGAEALLLFLVLLVASAAFVTLVATPLMAYMPVTGATVAALRTARAAAPVAPAPLPGASDWLVSLITPNPVAAAAHGALLPLVVFTLLFAAAATRVPERSRVPLIAFFRGVADTMLVLVRWVLWLAPVGVFALALTLGASTGFSVATTLLSFVLLVAAVCAAVTAALYVLVLTVARVPLTRFARAALPAQVVAFGTRSSLASLPAMVETAATELGVAAPITGFFLPLAVSTFKLGATIAIVTGTLFLGRIYGITLGAPALASIAIAGVVLSFSVPGVPGGLILVIAPVLATAGIPPQGLGVLLAVDTVPEMFRTVTNVTADLAAAVVLSRRMDAASPGAAAEPMT